MHLDLEKEWHITLEAVGTFEFIFTNPRLEPSIVTCLEHQDLKKLSEPHVLFSQSPALQPVMTP